MSILYIKKGETMIFLTIPDIKGQTFTINPNQITLIMESPKTLHGKLINDAFYIVLGKHSIEITEEIYTDLLRHIDRVTIDVAEPKINGIPKSLKCEDLELTVRLANCLSNLGIIYVHQVLDWSKTDLLKSKNFGRKSYNELREILEERFNAKLKGDQ
jgi:uncharacterized protein YlzI (FlbEa/FlbD family)